MIEKYEKKELKDGKKEYKEVAKKDATHKHICYHDEGNNQSCKRVKL